MIERTRKIQINPTVSEVAKAFCEMDADEQAAFFNFIDEHASTWERHICFQLQAITDSKTLSDAGRNMMCLIGQYSAKSGAEQQHPIK